MSSSIEYKCTVAKDLEAGTQPAHSEPRAPPVMMHCAMLPLFIAMDQLLQNSYDHVRAHVCFLVM